MERQQGQSGSRAVYNSGDNLGTDDELVDYSALEVTIKEEDLTGQYMEEDIADQFEEDELNSGTLELQNFLRPIESFYTLLACTGVHRKRENGKYERFIYSGRAACTQPSCQAKGKKNMISFSSVSRFQLKIHYKRMHSEVMPELDAALEDIRKRASSYRIPYQASVHFEAPPAKKVKTNPVEKEERDEGDRYAEMVMLSQIVHGTDGGRLLQAVLQEKDDIWQEITARFSQAAGRFVSKETVQALWSGFTSQGKQSSQMSEQEQWQQEFADCSGELSPQPLLPRLLDSKEPPMAELAIGGIGFIGGGSMAQAIADGLVAKGLVAASEISASAPSNRTQDWWHKRGMHFTVSNAECLARSNVVILAVKPHLFREALAALAAESPPQLSSGRLWISIMAGVALADLKAAINAVDRQCRVVRTIPNTAMKVGKGSVGITFHHSCTEQDRHLVNSLFSVIARCEVIPERQQNAFAALAGSGPAYIYQVIEALADGGVLMGLPRDLAMNQAAAMVEGAAVMVIQAAKEGKHPAKLKDDVCSPGGSTIRGIQKLEEGGVRAALIKAVQAAAERNEELGKQ